MKPASEHTVWITGASSGIGAALARAWAARGARCVLSARRPDALETVRSGCADPERHEVVGMDATAFDTHPAIVEDVYDRVGAVDILVLNSGVGVRGGGIQTELGVLRHIMDVNFTGAASHARLVAARMVERGSGHIVAISSVSGHVSVPWRGAYSASKHAMNAWFDSLRAEIDAAGVRVTIVCPGYVRTPMSRNSLTATGEPHGITDRTHQKGLDVDVCARRIVRAVGRGKAEYHVGRPEIWAIPLSRLFPGMVRRLARHYGTKPGK